MSRVQVWIPHLSKMSYEQMLSKYGEGNFDPSDPDLTDESMRKALELTVDLFQKFGPPAAIFHSHKRRCKQTAQPAIDRFGQHHRGGCLVMSLNTLGQPESGDLAKPGDPRADHKGLIYYGPKSYSPDWYRWFLASQRVIRSVGSALEDDGRAVFVFTHRPFAAAARWVVKNDWQMPVGEDDIDALDKSILPYVVLKEKHNGGLIEFPRE